MNLEIIGVNVLVGMLTGVTTGVTVGYFTFRSALKQFRTQRAFDRQLEWCERTTDSLREFHDLIFKVAFFLKTKDPHVREDVLGTMDATAEKFRKTVFDEITRAAFEM